MTELQRKTRQRTVILEELRKVSSHPTAAELYEMARRRLPRISLGTVYRNLDRLARNGIIRKLELGGGEARFDGKLERHYHVRCVHCGQVDDIHAGRRDAVKGGFRSVHGYEILGYHLEFTGICPECKGRADLRDPGYPLRRETKK